MKYKISYFIMGLVFWATLDYSDDICYDTGNPINGYANGG